MMKPEAQAPLLAAITEKAAKAIALAKGLDPMAPWSGIVGLIAAGADISALGHALAVLARVSEASEGDQG